jgi:hypothetical protein
MIEFRCGARLRNSIVLAVVLDLADAATIRPCIPRDQGSPLPSLEAAAPPKCHPPAAGAALLLRGN